MAQRVKHDVSQVLVDQAVQHFAAGTFTGNHPGGLEDSQMLADQRLWHAEGVDDLVHAALGLEQLEDDRDPHGRGEGPQGPMVRAPDLTDAAWQDRVKDEDIAETIRKGRNKMPPFDLPAQVIEGLVKRIRASRAR